MPQDRKIGQALQQAREEKQVSLEEVSQALHIRVGYLQALELDQPEKIPTQTQARGFLRTYASYLGIPLAKQDVLKKTRSEASLEPETRIDPSVPSNDNLSFHLSFQEIGTTLQERRHVLGLSKEDIEAHTHIPEHYVDYIESGEFHRFPSPAQARGMLNNYVNFLDVQADVIMGQYAEALQLRRTERQASPLPEGSRAKTPPPRNKRGQLPKWVRMFVTPDLLLIASVGMIVIFLTIWGIGRISLAQASRTPVPTAPSLVEALLPTATLIPTPTNTLAVSSENLLGNPDQPQLEATTIPTVQIAGGSTLQAYIITRQRAYLRVIVDGITAYDGRVIPGENLTFSGQEEIQILTGNAAALQIFFNDQDLGVLGIFGEVAEIFLTREGIIRPTPVPSPTIPPEELLTETSEPTPTSGVDLPAQQDTPVP